MTEHLIKEIEQLLNQVIEKFDKLPNLTETSFIETNYLLNRINLLIKEEMYEIKQLAKVRNPDLSEVIKAIMKVEEYQIGSFSLNARTRMLTRFGISKKLTSIEMQLLVYLSANNNKMLTRFECLYAVWNNISYQSARSMDVYICKIRKYLKEDDSVLLLNIHGKGFKMIF